MESKELQSPHREKQNEQYNGQRPTGKIGDNTQRFKEYR